MRDGSANDPTELTVSSSGLLGALGVFGLFVGGCAALVAAAFAARSWLHFDLDAVFWTEAGVVFLALTLTRPRWFWSHPKALLLRGIVGDRATLVVYLGLAAWIIGVGVRRQARIAHTRADCVRALAGVTDVHARLRVLYHAGAVGLPRMGDEPGALSCERLLENR